MIKHENFQIPKCIICGKDAKRENALNFYKTCSSKECLSELGKLRKLSKETKQKMSLSRLAYMKRMRVNSCWSLSKKYKESAAEQRVRELLEKIPDLQFKRWYKPQESERNFEIDFALVDKKIGLEVNGGQHYNKDGSFIEYHVQRKNHLEGLGWKIVDIDYKVCFDETRLREIINNILGGNVEFAEQKCNEVLSYRLERKKERERKLEEYKTRVLQNRLLRQLKKQETQNVEHKTYKKHRSQEEIKRLLQEKYTKYEQWKHENQLKLEEQRKIVLDILSKNENKNGIRVKIAKALNVHSAKVHCVLRKLGLNDQVKTRRSKDEIESARKIDLNKKTNKQKEENELFEKIQKIIDEFGNTPSTMYRIIMNIGISRKRACRICKEHGISIYYSKNKT